MENVQRVASNFFDIDDIIANCEATSCLFDSENVCDEFYTEMLGITKPTHNVGGASVDSPYWLIESVKNNCTISLPQMYGPVMQSVLTADARTINLERTDRYFYAVGMELCRLIKDDDPEGAYKLSKCLLTTLTQRLGGIIATSMHSEKKGEKMANLEKKVFEEGRKCKIDIDNWLNASSNIKTNKRKR